MAALFLPSSGLGFGHSDMLHCALVWFQHEDRCSGADRRRMNGRLTSSRFLRDPAEGCALSPGGFGNAMKAHIIRDQLADDGIALRGERI